jgi:hypothetical protein
LVAAKPAAVAADPYVLRGVRSTAAFFLVCAAGIAALVAVLPSGPVTPHDRLVSHVAVLASALVVSLPGWAALRFRAVVDREGIRSRTPLGTTSIAWGEVVGYSSAAGTVRLAKGLAGAVELAVSASARAVPHRFLDAGVIRLWTADGRTIRINAGLWYRNTAIAVALDRILAELHPRLRGRPLEFAPFTLTEAGLTHPKLGSVALADVSRVELVFSPRVAPEGFRVFMGAMTVPFMAARLADVHNPWLLVERLRGAGAEVVLHPSVFVPADVAATLGV